VFNSKPGGGHTKPNAARSKGAVPRGAVPRGVVTR
jgi:hypothetical protein